MFARVLGQLANFFGYTRRLYFVNFSFPKVTRAYSFSSQNWKIVSKEIHPNLDIVEVLEEKHSAFKPSYNRPVFENIIKRIRAGEATGIIQ